MKIKPSIKMSLKTLKDDEGNEDIVPTWSADVSISDISSQANADQIIEKMLKAIGEPAQETLDAFFEEMIPA